MSDENKGPIDSSEATLSLGAWLKEQRNKKRISLEEIAAVTKIHIAQLRNIEEDHMSVLPAPAFVRGFLVGYARHLGIDEDEVIARYRRSLGDRSNLEEPSQLIGNRAARSNTEPKVRVVGAPSFSQSATTKNLENEKSALLQPKFISLAAIVLAVLVGIGALVALGKKVKKESSKTPRAVELAEISSVSSPPPKTYEISDPRTSNQGGYVPSTATSVATQPSNNKGPVAPKKFQLEIKATEQNWVNVRIDDGNSQGILLKAGSVSPFQADRRVVLSLSDAGAVEIRWNGTWYGAPGFRGDVRSLTLPDELQNLINNGQAKPVARVKPKLKVVTPTPAAGEPASAPDSPPQNP